MTKSFSQTALASGLLSQKQLDVALVGIVSDASANADLAGQWKDEELAARLVQLGYLNTWQVEQLQKGHTKFKLGTYRILDAIGSGGMGHVFKGEHELLGRIEAIKVLPRGKNTPQAIANFLREIRLQAQFEHPNLVRVSYADRVGDTHFFVTEFVPGSDLRRLVRRHGPLSAAIAASILGQASEGLHYAHGNGLVHRDVKPGNLLITPEGRTKLSDFGLAWHTIDDVGPEIAGKAGKIVGTYDFLAPEVIRDPDHVQPVSDIYSLGCTLYYAVTGKVPFPGGTAGEKMRRHLHEAPLNPLHFNPDLPPDFCELIAQLMDKNPAARIPTARRAADLFGPWHSQRLSGDLLELSQQRALDAPTFTKRSAAAAPALAETASIELSDVLAAMPEDTYSASQVSQATQPNAASTQDTWPQDEKCGSASPVSGPRSDIDSVHPVRHRVFAGGLLVFVLIAAAMAWVA